jgi:hypothetical protein
MGMPSSAAITAEQLELARRLGTIFTPHARRQIDAHYGESGAPARFVHYTSAENALKIIETKSLWMRNATCMSDYREVHHGYDILKEFFSVEANMNSFTAALDSCAPGAAKEAIGHFDKWWSDIRNSTYISSISEHLSTEDAHGRLSMWRAFGNSTARVGIVVRVPFASGGGLALGIMFSPVAYLTKEQAHETIGRDVVKNIEANADFLKGMDRQAIINYVFTMLLAMVTCLKHEGFQEEREWRAIYSPNRLPSDLMLPITAVVAGVPQLVYKIPLDAHVSPRLIDLDIATIFDRLIIGPSQYPLAMYEAFRIALTKAGVADVGNKIVASGIPIRT